MTKRLPILLALLAVLGFLTGCDEEAKKKKKTNADFAEVFTDDFNRADGDLGTDWTEDIPTGSSVGIVGNRVESNADQGSPLVFYKDAIEAGTDERVTITAIVDGGDYDNSQDPLFAFIRAIANDRSLTSSKGAYLCGLVGNLLVIATVDDAGMIAALGTGTETIATTDGTTFDLTLSGEADEITCEAAAADTALDSVTITDGDLDGGFVGFAGGGAGTPVLFFDDFSLETKERSK